MRFTIETTSLIINILALVEATEDVCLSVKHGPEPEVIQGRPGKQGAAGPEGPVGPRGPQGNCTCDLTEVENLNTEVEDLRSLKLFFILFTKT